MPTSVAARTTRSTHGKGDADVGGRESDAIDPAVGLDGRTHADGDTAQRRQQHRRAREQQRARKPFGDVVDDGAVGVVRAPAIAAHVIARVAGTLHRHRHRQRRVELQLRAPPRNSYRIRPLTHHGLHRIVRRHMEQQAHHHQHAGERGHSKHQSARKQLEPASGIMSGALHRTRGPPPTHAERSSNTTAGMTWVAEAPRPPAHGAPRPPTTRNGRPTRRRA